MVEGTWKLKKIDTFIVILQLFIDTVTLTCLVTYSIINGHSLTDKFNKIHTGFLCMYNVHLTFVRSILKIKTAGLLTL